MSLTSRRREEKQENALSNGGDAVTVLWVSRHPPLPAQWRWLEERLGKKVRVVQEVGHIPSAEHVAELAKRHGARYVVPVLPLSFIARLVELAPRYGFEVLWSKMKTIWAGKDPEQAERLVAEDPEKRTAVTYGDGTTRVYEFDTMERIVEVKIVTEPL